MLVLTRRTGEVLRIGDAVTVTLKETARGKCKLAIDAPRDVAVWRGEIWERMQAEGEAEDGERTAAG